MIEAMCAYQRRYQLSSIGTHRSLANEMLGARMKTCDLCKGRGVISINEGEGCEICPRCDIKQYLFDGSPEEFETLRQKILMVFPYASPDVPMPEKSIASL
jgi:hypothetical protein